jgi:hypothetical protein
MSEMEPHQKARSTSHQNFLIYKTTQEGVKFSSLPSQRTFQSLLDTVLRIELDARVPPKIENNFSKQALIVVIKKFPEADSKITPLVGISKNKSFNE